MIWFDNKRKWLFLSVISLFVLGFLVRIVPASFSSLPYNIDGFPMARIASNIVETGSWRVGGSGLILYNSKMPGLPMLVAFASAITGASTLTTIRFLLPLIGSTTVLSGGYLTYVITRNRGAAVGASIFFALNGFFVYLTSAAMKEVLGLALMPLAFLFFLRRKEGYNLLGLLLVLVSMVFVHHLTFLLLSTILILALFYSLVSGYFEGEKNGILKEAPTSVVLVVSILLGWYYYKQFSLEHMSYIPFSEQVLLGFMIVLWAMFGSIVLFSTDISKRSKLSFSKIFLVVCIAVAGLVANYFISLFGTITTSSLLLLLIVPYVLLMVFPLMGFEILRSTHNNAKPLILAGFVGPMVFITYSVVSGLDAVSFNLLYRSYDYIDISLGVCAGIGLVYVMGQLKERKNLRRSLPVIFVALAFLTLPLAYSGQELYGLKDVTEDHEFSALSATADFALSYNLTVYTDQRLANVIEPYFEVEAKNSLPMIIHDSSDLPKDSILVLSSSWLSDGAQIFPFPNIVITEDQWNNTLDQTSLLFYSGPPGSEIFVLYSP